MKKVILITAKNCYPYKAEIVNRFECIEGINVYNECIAPLSKELSKELEKIAKDNSRQIELNQKTAIGLLFSDAKAQWTQEAIFKNYMENGIPLLRKTYGNMIFYVLPCTGTTYLQGDHMSLLRQKYTSFCIDLICKLEPIERENIYAVIHSDDTGVGGGADSGKVKDGALVENAPLVDIANSGHLILFHHTAGDTIFDPIVKPVCNGADKLDFESIGSLFSQDNIGWWTKLAKLNNKEY